ncbi:MAG: PLP-dependent transferase [Planctomycetota bacterium]|nr:PLP-dependent transferase [Planctomycetota bacterium]
MSSQSKPPAASQTPTNSSLKASPPDDAGAPRELAEISPRRKTTQGRSASEMAHEQLTHFGIDPASEYGSRLAALTQHLYAANADLHALWNLGVQELASLPRRERLERFNAQKFLSFQLAKMLDTLQNPQRATYQSLINTSTQRAIKGTYPVFDNIAAIFASRPAIVRTATYIYACAEWVDEAFQGREMLHSIYSRLLNPTSVALANHIVDIEAGPLNREYFAWNFNSGMAAVDGVLSHLVGHRDVILSSRNVYGGVYQLMHDWFGKRSNLDVAVHFETFYTGEEFQRSLDKVTRAEAERLRDGRRIYVYLESPCNPHGYVLDVPAICRVAHERGLDVICDSTVGTPFLHRPLQRSDPMERPDFVIHSYTKDLAGHGGTTAGVVIGRNERMFVPKGARVTAPGPDGKPREHAWDESMFWNVFYVKGAFLDAEKAFEVLTGIHTLELRMLRKAINTLTLAEFLAAHPLINVKCNAAPGNENSMLRERCLFLGLPAPLFTLDFEGKGSNSAPPSASTISRGMFQRFFDSLEPAFGHQVSLGQPNTVVLCPALTSHSEMSPEALRAADIAPTTIRVAVGLEDPRTLIVHLMKAAEATIDHELPGFSRQFPTLATADAIYRKHFASVHAAYAAAQPSAEELAR